MKFNAALYICIKKDLISAKVDISFRPLFIPIRNMILLYVPSLFVSLNADIYFEVTGLPLNFRLGNVNCWDIRIYYFDQNSEWQLLCRKVKYGP